MSFFVTRDAHLASLIRYELGVDSHIETSVESNGHAVFTFANSAACDQIMRQFYRKPEDDDFEGYLIGDARRLLKEAHQVRKAVMAARDVRRAVQKEPLQ